MCRPLAVEDLNRLFTLPADALGLGDEVAGGARRPVGGQQVAHLVAHFRTAGQGPFGSVDVRCRAEIERFRGDGRIAAILGREFRDDAPEFFRIRAVGVAVKHFCAVDQSDADAEVDARGDVPDLVRQGGDVVDLVALHEHLGEIGAEGYGMVDGGLRDAGVEHGVSPFRLFG